MPGYAEPAPEPRPEPEPSEGPAPRTAWIDTYVEDLDPLWNEAIAAAHAEGRRARIERSTAFGFLGAALGLVVGAMIYVYRDHYYTVLSLWDVTLAALCVTVPLTFTLEGTITAAAATPRDGVLATSQGYVILRGRIARVIPREAFAEQFEENREIKLLERPGGLLFDPPRPGKHKPYRRKRYSGARIVSKIERYITIEARGGLRVKYGPLHHGERGLDLPGEPDELASPPRSRVLAHPAARWVVGAATVVVVSLLIALPIKRLRNLARFERDGRSLLCSFDPPDDCLDSATPHDGERRSGSTVQYAYFVRDWSGEFPRARLLAVARKRYIALLEDEIAREWAQLREKEGDLSRWLRLRNLLVERDGAAGDGKYKDLTEGSEVSALQTYAATHPPR